MVTVEDILLLNLEQTRSSEMFGLRRRSSGGTKSQKSSDPPCLGVGPDAAEGARRAAFIRLRDGLTSWKLSHQIELAAVISRGLRGRIGRSGQTTGLGDVISHKQLEAHQRTSVPEGRAALHTSAEWAETLMADLYITVAVCPINTTGTHE